MYQHQVIYILENTQIIAISKPEFWTIDELLLKKGDIEVFKEGLYKAKVFFQDKNPVAVFLYGALINYLTVASIAVMEQKGFVRQDILTLPSIQVTDISLVKLENNEVLKNVQLLKPLQ